MKPKSTLRSFLAAIGGSILAISSAMAQTTYSYTQNAGGTQLWEDAANWSGGSIPDPVAGDTIQANLSMTAATLLDLGADRTFETWTSNFGGFNSSDFTIKSGFTITLDGTNPTITHNGKGSVTMENILAGSAGLKKNGSQTLVLNNAANSFSGGIELAAGTLKVASDGALGAASNDLTVTGNSSLTLANNMTMARDVALNTGTTLTFTERTTTTISGAVTGEGGIYMSPTGFGTQSLTLSSTGNTFTGAIKVGNDSAATLTVNSLADSANSLELRLSNKGDTKFVWGSGATSALVLTDRQFILSGNQTTSHVIENANADSNNTVTLNKDLSVTSTKNRKLVLGGVNTGANSIAGVIPDGVLSGDPLVGFTSLEKTGSSKWILSAVNTYTGATTVTAGTLLVNGSTTAGSAVTVNGGTLGGTGTVGGSVTVNSGGLAPGASAGVLAIGGDLDISALAGDQAGTLVFELGAIGSSDRINVTGSLNIGTDLLRFSDFTFSPLAGLADGTYTLISSSSLANSLDPTPANLTGTVGSGTGTLAISGNNLVLQVSGIGGGPTAPYDTWATSEGLTGAPGSSTDPAKDADPDGDGSNNLAEFAFNGDPLSGSDNGKVFVLTADSDFDGDTTKELILTVAVRTATPAFTGSPAPSAYQATDGITYTIEGSLDLASFPTPVNVVPTTVTTGLPAAGTGYEYRSFSLSGSNGLTGKGFLRAKVTTP